MKHHMETPRNAYIYNNNIAPTVYFDLDAINTSGDQAGIIEKVTLSIKRMYVQVEIYKFDVSPLRV